jgi:hypothetical protein
MTAPTTRLVNRDADRLDGVAGRLRAKGAEVIRREARDQTCWISSSDALAPSWPNEVTEAQWCWPGGQVEVRCSAGDSRAVVGGGGDAL